MWKWKGCPLMTTTSLVFSHVFFFFFFKGKKKTKKGFEFVLLFFSKFLCFEFKCDVISVL